MPWRASEKPGNGRRPMSPSLSNRASAASVGIHSRSMAPGKPSRPPAGPPEASPLLPAAEHQLSVACPSSRKKSSSSTAAICWAPWPTPTKEERRKVALTDVFRPPSLIAASAASRAALCACESPAAWAAGLSAAAAGSSLPSRSAGMSRCRSVAVVLRPSASSTSSNNVVPGLAPASASQWQCSRADARGSASAPPPRSLRYRSAYWSPLGLSKYTWDMFCLKPWVTSPLERVVEVVGTLTVRVAGCTSFSRPTLVRMTLAGGTKNACASAPPAAAPEAVGDQGAEAWSWCARQEA
mmetsp:Transcript_36654/g.116672  ORF Transcript_36654/g.116672 Transcript_36654/m.116672 type:complete len:297 (+) Transcript_36654:192-1082(+)